MNIKDMYITLGPDVMKHYADKISERMVKQIEENMKRPPQGITPKYIHDEQRRDDIKAAIQRFTEVNRPIPAEWIAEYNELVKR